tara:strand:- start:497 stop:931 length:435 start_codon:yes stop_codon:yes gene_type:complete
LRIWWAAVAAVLELQAVFTQGSGPLGDIVGGPASIDLRLVKVIRASGRGVLEHVRATTDEQLVAPAVVPRYQPLFSPRAWIFAFSLAKSGKRLSLTRGTPCALWKEPFTPEPQACQPSSIPMLRKPALESGVFWPSMGRTIASA